MCADDAAHDGDDREKDGKHPRRRRHASDAASCSHGDERDGREVTFACAWSFCGESVRDGVGARARRRCSARGSVQDVFRRLMVSVHYIHDFIESLAK